MSVKRKVTVPDGNGIDPRFIVLESTRPDVSEPRAIASALPADPRRSNLQSAYRQAAGRTKF